MNFCSWNYFSPTNLTNIHWNGFWRESSVTAPIEATKPRDEIAKNGVLLQLDHLEVRPVVKHRQVLLLHESRQRHLDQRLQLLEVGGQLGELLERLSDDHGEPGVRRILLRIKHSKQIQLRFRGWNSNVRYRPILLKFRFLGKKKPN